MKIIASCLVGLCLVAWTTGCGCTRQHARCVEWDGPSGPNSHVADGCGCQSKGLSKFLKPKCKSKYHGLVWSGGHCDCEPNPCCGPVAPGCCESAGMPIMQGGVPGNCCGGEPALVGGMMPTDANISGPIMESGGCTGCAGGQVMPVPPAKMSGNCPTCGPSVSSAPQPPTTGWSASGSYGNQLQTSVRPAAGGCATGNCQGAVIGEGIIYDNVTTPAPMPVLTTNTTFSSTTLQNAPPPPPPLPGGN